MFQKLLEIFSKLSKGTGQSFRDLLRTRLASDFANDPGKTVDYYEKKYPVKMDLIKSNNAYIDFLRNE